MKELTINMRQTGRTKNSQCGLQPRHPLAVPPRFGEPVPMSETVELEGSRAPGFLPPPLLPPDTTRPSLPLSAHPSCYVSVNIPNLSSDWEVVGVLEMA